MIRVLLADDHEILRAGLRLLVDAQEDMNVVAESATGEQTIEQVRARCPDVAVLDLTMPGMGGLKTARILGTEAGETKVVVLTRHSDDAYVRELFAAGATGYVLKHSGSAELLHAIRAAARNERYLDPALRANDNAAKNGFNAGATATSRERDVLRLTAMGFANKEIASRLNISVRTVEVHKTSGMRKLQLAGRADVVRYAVMVGWMEDP